MKLFIWDITFSDHVEGAAFAFANSEDEARGLIENEIQEIDKDDSDDLLKKFREQSNLFKVKVVEKSQGFVVGIS